MKISKNLIKYFSFALCLLSFSQAQALDPVKPFDWAAIMELPPLGDGAPGAQILHFKTTDKPYALSQDATKFVNQNLQGVKEFSSDAETLRFASDNVGIDGYYIELGALPGRSINFIAALNPHHIIYGFDCFTGMPSDWVKKDKTAKKGTFRYKDSHTLPQTLANVKIFKGLYKDVLPKFVDQYLKNQPIALLHCDSDTYFSTKDGLDALKNNIVSGTIIIFDEFYNYPGFEEHEYKAFKEFLATTKYTAEYLAFNGKHQQVVIRVK